MPKSFLIFPRICKQRCILYSDLKFSWYLASDLCFLYKDSKGYPFDLGRSVAQIFPIFKSQHMQSLGAAFLKLFVLEPHEKFIKKEKINLAGLIICFNIFNTTNAVAHWIFKMTSIFFCLKFASLGKVHACTCQWLMVDLNSCVCTHLFFSGKSHTCHWNWSKFNFWKLLSLWSWWKQNCIFTSTVSNFWLLSLPCSPPYPS